MQLFRDAFTISFTPQVTQSVPSQYWFTAHRHNFISRQIPPGSSHFLATLQVLAKAGQVTKIKAQIMTNFFIFSTHNDT
jgi:hypothetical protein